MDGQDEAAWNKIVARYEERKAELIREGASIRDKYSGSADRGRRTAIDTTGPYLEALHEFRDLAERYGEPADYELHQDARLLAHDLGDRFRRVPFDDLDDNQQGDFLMYSYVFDNPPIDQPINWAYSRRKGRDLYDEHDTLSFWHDWINHLEHGTPFPRDRDS